MKARGGCDLSGRKQLLGVLWIPATMRRNNELFYRYMCFDVMKRGINTLLWPYVLLALCDEFGELCVGCKGIVCGEVNDMYQFMVDFIQKACPKLKLEDVKIVSADQFLPRYGSRTGVH